jgi:hypothetical protein
MTNSIILLQLTSKFQKHLLKIMNQALKRKLINSTTLESFILECTENSIELMADELEYNYPTAHETNLNLSYLRELYLPFCKRVKLRPSFREFRAFVEHTSLIIIDDYTNCFPGDLDIDGCWAAWVLCREEFYFTSPLRTYYELNSFEENELPDQNNIEDRPF